MTPAEQAKDSYLVELENQLASARSLYEQTGRESFRLAIEEIESEIRQLKSAHSNKEQTLVGKVEIVDGLRCLGFFDLIPDGDRRFIYMDLVAQVRALRDKVVEIVLKF